MYRKTCSTAWILAVLWTVCGCASISDRSPFGLAALETGNVLTPVSKETRRREHDSCEYVATATYKAVSDGKDIAVTLRAAEEATTVNPQEKVYGSLQGARVRKHLALSELVVKFGNGAVYAPQPALRRFKEPHLDKVSFQRLSRDRIILSLKGSDGGEAYTARFIYRDTRLTRIDVWQRGPDARLHAERVWP